MSTKKGYTLIELLIVIAIMAILFSLGYASYQTFARKKNLENAARQVEGDLRLAQAKAKAGEIPTYCNAGERLDSIIFSSDTNTDTYSLSALCLSGSGSSITENQVGIVGKQNITLPFGTHITDANIEFYTVERGVVGGTITISQDNTSNSYNINVGGGGEIYVSD